MPGVVHMRLFPFLEVSQSPPLSFFSSFLEPPPPSFSFFSASCLKPQAPYSDPGWAGSRGPEVKVGLVGWLG